MRFHVLLNVHYLLLIVGFNISYGQIDETFC